MADCKIPEIPFASGVDQNLQRILAPIKETLDIWAGRAGDSLCRHVTIEDLLDETVTVNITSTGGSGNDPDAIHDDVASEILAVSLKATPAATDLLLIEDSADSYSKKRTTFSAFSGTDELLSVSANDTTPGYLEDKFVVSHGTNTANPLELSTLNDGADEDRQLQFDESKVDHANLLNLTTGDPHTQYQQESEKSAANGYASLGATTLVPTAELGTGSASTSTYLRGDQTWQTIGAGSDELSKVSSNDTTAGYLEDKIVVASGTNTTNILELSTLNDGLDEDVQIQIDESKIDHANLLNLATGDPHTQYQQESEKGSANGYAGLGAGGYVPTAQLGSGTADSSSYLRGDQTWAVVSTGSGDTVKVSSNDTTAGYLEDKIVVSDGSNTTNILELSTLNDGADEDVQIQIDEGKIDHANLLSLTTGDPHTQYQLESGKSAANGYASLGATTLVPTAELGTGSPDSTYYLRGDQTWQLLSGIAGSHTITSHSDVVDATGAQLEELTGGGDTTLHDHDGISENTSARHTQGSDTTLGTMTADINMNSLYQVVGLQAPAAAGEAIRQTTNITEANLETLTDNSIADALHRHSELVASDGSPDPALSVDAAGLVSLISGTGINEFSIDGTLAGNSDDAVPTEKAVVTYVAAHGGSGAFAEDALGNIVGGTNAGSELSTGVDNFYAVESAGRYGDGSYNIGIGYCALEGTTLNNYSYNIGIGFNTGIALTTGSNNIIMGADAGKALITSGGNVIIGHDACQEQTTAPWNVFIGERAGRYAQNGSNNIAIGYSAGAGVTGTSTYSSTVLIGQSAGQDLTTATGNTFIGNTAGYNDTTGSANVAVGQQTFYYHTAGYGNVFLGSQAGYGYSGATGWQCDYNVGIGFSAMVRAVTASRNVAIGPNSGYYNETGDYNVFVGYDTGRGATGVNNPSNSVAIGYQAGQDLINSLRNTLIGNQSGLNVSTGNDNTCLGNQSGDNITTGSDNIIIGSGIDPPSATASNQFALGNDTYPFLRGDMANYQLAIYGASGYLNFNTTLGSTGYGIRDNAGVMEAKDTDEEWVPIITPRENALINQDFSIWQENTTFTNPATTVYTADGWLIYSTATGTLPTINVKKNTAAVEVGFGQCAELEVTAVGTGPFSWRFYQKVEDFEHYRGKTVTASIRIKSSVAMSFGVNTRIWVYDGVGSFITGISSLTTSWQTFTVTATISTTATLLWIIFEINTSISTTGSIYIQWVKLELGSTATDLIPRSTGEELRLCQRYYQKSYLQTVFPGATTDVGIRYLNIQGCTSAANSTTRRSTRLPVVMKAAPTITLYDRVGASGKVSMTSDGVTGTASNTSDAEFTVEGTDANTTTARTLFFHYVAVSRV